MTSRFRDFSLLLVLGLAGLLLFCSGCDQQGGEPQQIIRLDKTAPLPVPPAEPRTAALRVAVAAILSPQGTIESYQSLLNYLKNKTHGEVTLIQRKTYQETNDLLARNVVDVAFVCTGAYMQGREHMDILVVPRIDGKTTYRSLLITPASSPATGMKDLRGKVFAFTDPLSNSGYLHPVSRLRNMGETPETFFARAIFTYSHDRSISAVREGIADGAAVDSIIYAFFEGRSGAPSKTKVIEQSEEFGMPPVVVPKGIDPQKKAELRALFLGIDQTPEGRAVLAEMGIERFVSPDHDRYESGGPSPPVN